MFDLWDHQFCLACDKQVESEEAAYCSEACRLADFEKISTPPWPSSLSSSFGCSSCSNSYPWRGASNPTSPSASSRTKFYLAPAYDFTNAQPYHSTAEQQAVRPNMVLSPSSSHSSLYSMQSSSTLDDGSHLSDQARQELRAYAISFQQVRNQRRPSQ